MNEIDYYGYKTKEKKNIIEKNNIFSYSSSPIQDQIFKNESSDTEKIVLTKIGKKDGDSVVIYSYNPYGDIRKTGIEFKHFDIENNEWYRVKIMWWKENNFLMFLQNRNRNSGYWRICITLISENISDEICTDLCEEGTEASNKITEILDDPLKTTNEKIVEIINHFRYTNIKRDIMNLSLF